MTAQSPSVESIFSAALEIANADDRVAYLDEACGNDSALRQRIDALLRANTEAGSFLEQPIANLDATNTSLPDETRPEHSHASADDLTFLLPCDKPGRLGMLRGASGEYEIIEPIGRGGMGTVFRAFYDKLSRVVAVKIMSPLLAANPGAVKRFLREAKAAGSVRHDNVVIIHAVDDEHRPPFMIMEYVEGQTLGQKIEREGALELVQILRIGSQIAAGLAAAHNLGLIHRDIKPSNILLQNSIERVKITDFGLARAADDVETTRPGLISGTPQYMSPEQAQGETIDARSDLFSMGSILYTMSTGRPAFRAETALAVMRRVCNDAPRSILDLNPQLPAWLEKIVLKLLAKNPRDRFQSAAEIAELLEQHLAHEHNPSQVPKPPDVIVTTSVSPPVVSTPRSAATRAPLNRYWIAATILGILATLLLILFVPAAFTFVGSSASEAQPGEFSAGDLPDATHPADDHPAVPKTVETDPLQADTVWHGSRTYRKGFWEGQTVAYEFYVHERSGAKFKGHSFNNGSGRNRCELEGEIHGHSISWLEQTLDPQRQNHIRGTLVGNTIRFTLQSKFLGGAFATEADGELVLAPRDSSSNDSSSNGQPHSEASLPPEPEASTAIPAPRGSDRNEPLGHPGFLPINSAGSPVNLSFEDGTLAGWKATGGAFKGQPFRPSQGGAKPSGTNQTGAYLIDGWTSGGDRPQGTLTSELFVVTHPYASYLIGGASKPETRVEVVTANDGQVFHSATGKNAPTLSPVIVDLRNIVGQPVFVRLVDQHSGGWGHIKFDDFRFHKSEPKF